MGDLFLLWVVLGDSLKDRKRCLRALYRSLVCSESCPRPFGTRGALGRALGEATSWQRRCGLLVVAESSAKPLREATSH